MSGGEGQSAMSDASVRPGCRADLRRPVGSVAGWPRQGLPPSELWLFCPTRLLSQLTGEPRERSVLLGCCHRAFGPAGPGTGDLGPYWGCMLDPRIKGVSIGGHVGSR